MNKQILDKFGSFVFGIGGVGDALLLLSAFYDEHPDYGLVFWANGRELIEKLCDAFGVKRRIVFQGWQTKDQFDLIVSHPNFQTKGHIPDDISKYVQEWSQNSAKYLKEIKIPFEYLKSFGKDGAGCVGLAPFGSSEDSWKKKSLEVHEVERLVNKFSRFETVLFGGPNDLPHDNFSVTVDARGYSFAEQFKRLNSCRWLIGVDSWSKTYTQLAGIQTAVIRSRYTRPLQEIFGMPFDAADLVFLNGLKVYNLEEILNADVTDFLQRAFKYARAGR